MSATLKKRKTVNRNQLREAFVEQMYRAVDKRGFVDELFKMLDEIKDPNMRLGKAIELMKFVMPQLAAQKIEVEQTGKEVERVVFQPLIGGKPKE